MKQTNIKKASYKAGFISLAASFIFMFGTVTTPAYAGNSCATLICMYGLATGSAGGECKGPIEDYFKIIDWDIPKGIDWSGTKKKRKHYLESCPGHAAASDQIDKIMNLYGTLSSLP